MPQQTKKKSIACFPPIGQMMKRYKSVSLTKPTQRIATQSQNSDIIPSFVSYKSTSSIGSLQKEKHYKSKSMAFFKNEARIKFHLNKVNELGNKVLSTKQLKREIDKKHILQAYKRMNEPRVHPILMKKQQSLFKMSSYSNFMPFKRNHEVSRCKNKVIVQNPESKEMTKLESKLHK